MCSFSKVSATFSLMTSFLRVLHLMLKKWTSPLRTCVLLASFPMIDPPRAAVPDAVGKCRECRNQGVVSPWFKMDGLIIAYLYWIKRIIWSSIYVFYNRLLVTIQLQLRTFGMGLESRSCYWFKIHCLNILHLCCSIFNFVHNCCMYNQLSNYNSEF